MHSILHLDDGSILFGLFGMPDSKYAKYAVQKLMPKLKKIINECRKETVPDVEGMDYVHSERNDDAHIILHGIKVFSQTMLHSDIDGEWGSSPYVIGFVRKYTAVIASAGNLPGMLVTQLMESRIITTPHDKSNVSISRNEYK